MSTTACRWCAATGSCCPRKWGNSPNPSVPWTAWKERDLLGCGALFELDPLHGEIKSMRTARGHLRKGVSSSMLQHIMAEAERRSYTRLSLETGSMEAFAPAHALYTGFGFTLCEPFGSYVLDPNSVFMTRAM